VVAAADTFVERVTDEDYPDVLEALVAGLVLWKRIDSLPKTWFIWSQFCLTV